MEPVTIYYTSDTHGYLFPTNYVDDEIRPMGMLQAMHQFHKDENTIIIDGGDTLQGSAMAKYAQEHPSVGIPQAKVFNAAGYDLVVLGNHDFNYGYERLADYLNALDAECLCANVIDRKDSLHIKPYKTVTFPNGLKVGFVGVVTDYVNLWEKPENLTHIGVTDAFSAASQALQAIKSQCDVTVCIYHGGYEADLETGKSLTMSRENIGYRIATELSYDVLLCAHQHMDIPGCLIGRTYTLQLPANAAKFAKLHIKKEDSGDIEISGETIQTGIEHDEHPYQELLPLERKVQTWLAQPIGHLAQAIPPVAKLESAYSGSRIADFYNQIQLDHTRADFSCTSLGNSPAGFSRNVTVQQIIATYQFPNTLVVLEVDEPALRLALERCAEYFTLEPDGTLRVSDCFVKPKVEHYNYDYFAGFSYTFDIRKPIGSRVVRLLYKGKPLGDRKFSLCMNNYRASGTGGFEVYQSCKILQVINEDVQDLTIDYLRAHPVLENWQKPDFKVIW